MILKKMYKSFFIILTLVVLAGCGVDHSRNTLVVGTSAGFPPFEYVSGNGNGDIVGFDIDFARQIAIDSGKQLVVKDLPFDDLITALNSGQIDMIAAGMTVTPERQASVQFSQPYYVARQLLLSDVKNQFDHKAQLANKHVATQAGTTGELLGKDLTSNLLLVDSGSEAVKLLIEGKVDAVLFDSAPAKQLISGRNVIAISPLKFPRERYAFAVAKNDVKLLNQINSTISKMQGDGRYEELVAKYIR